MTKSTSSFCAPGTTEGSRQDRTGRPPIEKSNVPTWTPEEMNAAVDDFLTRYGNGEQRMSDWGYFWWDLKATVRHWFGHHTMIPSETWQKDPDRRLRIVKTGERCWKCEHVEP